MVVLVATTDEACPPSERGDAEYIEIPRHKFFGVKSWISFGETIPISSPVKTAADCLDRPDLAGGAVEVTRILHRALGEVNPRALLDTLVAMRSPAALQRFGFLSDLVNRPLPDDVRTDLRAAIPREYRSDFGGSQYEEGDIGYVETWGLQVNRKRDHLLSEVPRILKYL
jgi:predicted transcriptional regulator of viral defense system